MLLSLYRLKYTYHFKDGVVLTEVDSGYETGSTDQTTADVRYNIPVQVGQHHYVKLLGPGHHLDINSIG